MTVSVSAAKRREEIIQFLARHVTQYVKIPNFHILLNIVFLHKKVKTAMKSG